MITPMQQLLVYLESLEKKAFFVNPTTIAEEIKAKYIDLERVQITQAFDAGEINMHNSKRDEGLFEYIGGKDYFSKSYDKK